MGEGLPSRTLKKTAESNLSENFENKFDLNKYAEEHSRKQQEKDDLLKPDKEQDARLQIKTKIETDLRLNFDELGITEEQVPYATAIVLEGFQDAQEIAKIMGAELSWEDYFQENLKKINSVIKEKTEEVQNEKEDKIKLEVEQFINKNLHSNGPKKTLHDFFDPTKEETKSLREGLKSVDPARFEKYQKYLDL